MKLQKIIYHGDMNTCRNAEHDSKRMLGKLYDTLGIDDDMQGWQPVRELTTGVFVHIHIGLNVDTINIFAEAPSSEDSPAIEIAKITKKCLCTCNMAIGKIVERVLSRTPGTPYANIGLDEAPFYIYKVNVCQREFTYVAFENVLGCDFTPWKIGMKVSVIAYNNFLFGCCLSDSENLSGFDNFSASGCRGKVNPSLDMTDYAWRTTYRISQLCVLSMPYWEELNA